MSQQHPQAQGRSTNPSATRLIPIFVPSPCASGERIPRRISHSEPMNPCAPFLLPLLHTLVEERAGERRLRSRFRFMGKGTWPSPPKAFGEEGNMQSDQEVKCAQRDLHREFF